MPVRRRSLLQELVLAGLYKALPPPRQNLPAAQADPNVPILATAGSLSVCVHAGALFFKNWSSLSPLERYRSWDKKFQLLKSYPNVLISPHSAFLTQEALDNIATTTVANIKEFQAGSKLTFEVLPK